MESKHNQTEEGTETYSPYAWDKLVGDQMDVKQKGDIRMPTWNIRKKATLGVESKEPQAKIEIVMDYMRSMEIQIMALQETGKGREQAKAIERAVNSKNYKAYTNPNKSGQYGFENILQ